MGFNLLDPLNITGDLWDAPEQKITPTSTLTPEQNKGLQQLLTMSQGQLFGQNGIAQADPFQFGGNRVAGFGGLTQDRAGH